MSDVTVNEARVKVVEAEGQILQILRQLQDATGVNIDGIDVQVVHSVGGNFMAIVRIKTKL